MSNDKSTQNKTTLVLGGTGKTGRRVVERLTERGLPVRVGSRSGKPPFDWEDDSTWAPALEGVGAVYLTYYPDIAVPGARRGHAVVRRAGAERSGSAGSSLLSGRGEPIAERAEQAVRDTGAELTILRSTWFMQNFSEDYMLRARAERRDPAPGRRGADAVRRRRRHRRRRGRGADGRPARRASSTS